MRPFLVTCLVALCACPPPPAQMDSGTPEDSGMTMDAGHDGGRPPRDAGFDAGWASVPEAQWCRSRAIASCRRDLRCGLIDDTLGNDCIARFLQTCDNAAYLFSASLGLHAYDPVRAAKCLDAYDVGPCETIPAQCGDVFTGLSTFDGGVFVPEDCDPDAGFFNLSESTCPHHCSRYAELGQPCFDNSGRYAPSCKPGVHGCAENDAGQEVCQPPLLEGEACTGPYSCRSELECYQGHCVKHLAATGERCNTTGYYPLCAVSDFCRKPANDAGTCERRAGLGGVCAGYSPCLPSLYCTSSFGTGTCQRRASVGEPCSQNEDCAAGLWCPTRASRCAPLPADGGDCSYSTGTQRQCAVGFGCDLFQDYTCVPKSPEGGPCRFGLDDLCQSNECQYGPLRDGGTGYHCVRCASVDAG